MTSPGGADAVLSHLMEMPMQSPPSATADTAQAGCETSSAERMQRVHVSLSAALRHDYFSTGKGHLQSRAVLARRQSAVPRVAPGDVDNEAKPRSLPTPAEELDHVEVNASAEVLEEAEWKTEPGPHAASDTQPEAATRAERANAETMSSDGTAQYLDEVARQGWLTSSEEYRLARLAADGDLASRHRLIERHLGLVVMMARRQQNKGLHLSDLIEEGNLGLITAAGKFDPELGYRFSTYAKWWVKQSIDLAVMAQSRLVRMPIHLTRSLKKAVREKHQAQQSGQEPESTTFGATLVALLADDDRDDGILVDDLPASDAGSPEEAVAADQRTKALARMLDTLNRKERIVVRGRFGLDGGEPRTLQDLADQFKLSCERVRQVEKEAVVKLKALFDQGGYTFELLCKE